MESTITNVTNVMTCSVQLIYKLTRLDIHYSAVEDKLLCKDSIDRTIGYCV